MPFNVIADGKTSPLKDISSGDPGGSLSYEAAKHITVTTVLFWVVILRKRGPIKVEGTSRVECLLDAFKLECMNAG